MRQPLSPRRAGLIVVTGSLVAACCHSALGQEPQPAAQPTIPGATDLETIIARLDSPDVQVRTDATDRIRSDRAITLRMIETHLRSDKLSPEQRQRLNAVAFIKFREGPHAAMGIRRYR